MKIKNKIHIIFSDFNSVDESRREIARRRISTAFIVAGCLMAASAIAFKVWG